MAIFSSSKFFRSTGRALGWLLLALSLGAPAQAAKDPFEYQVKATFLFNFLQFVEWPATATQPGAPYIIAVAGEPAYLEAIAAVVNGERIGDRPILVRPWAAQTRCHLLFVSDQAPVPSSGWPQTVHDQPILLVGETADFCANGGMIGFIYDQGRVRFEINAPAAAAVGLKLSSKLQRLGRAVTTRKGD
ncbi:MAG: YfiR family protein [Opitutae bacterium]|nr:YfiR family protein [Opitutae bacterium]